MKTLGVREAAADHVFQLSGVTFDSPPGGTAPSPTRGGEADMANELIRAYIEVLAEDLARLARAMDDEGRKIAGTAWLPDRMADARRLLAELERLRRDNRQLTAELERLRQAIA
jgi:hypothetical protein